MLLFGGIFYAIFAEGTVQPWANDDSKDDDVEKTRLKWKYYPILTSCNTVSVWSRFEEQFYYVHSVNKKIYDLLTDQDLIIKFI